jgi:hypothetical protein
VSGTVSVATQFRYRRLEAWPNVKLLSPRLIPIYEAWIECRLFSDTDLTSGLYIVEYVWNSQESELPYDWRFTANQFVLATSPSRLAASNFIFQLNTWGYSPYVTSSLTRGWVCRLQLLLVLANAIILRSESRGTHDHILLSQIRDFPNLEGQILVYMYPPGTEWPGDTPRHWVPFSPPPTTQQGYGLLGIWLWMVNKYEYRRRL